MINKEKVVDDVLEIAFTHPNDTILVRIYNRDGSKEVYASDYFIREVDDIMDNNIWRVKVEIVSGVVDGKWKITGSRSYEENTIVNE